MVFNATFNNISAISWQSVLLLEETGEPRDNQEWYCKDQHPCIYIKMKCFCSFTTSKNQ